MGNRARWEKEDRSGHAVLQVFPDPLAHLGKKEFQGTRDHQDHRDQSGLWVKLDIRDLQGQRENLGHQVN